MIWNYAGVVFHNASGVNVGGRTGHRPRQASSSSMLSFIYPPTSRHDESCAPGGGGRESPTDFERRLTRGEHASRGPSLIYPPTSRHDESCALGGGGRESPTDFGRRLTRGEHASRNLPSGRRLTRGGRALERTLSYIPTDLAARRVVRAGWRRARKSNRFWVGTHAG
jgi:hypothetical protein